jgi:hypothetical protein
MTLGLFDPAFLGGLVTTPAGPTDPYFSNVSLLLHGDGANGSTTIVDNSPSPKTVTAYGNAQISTAQSKFGGASIAFDGSGDYTSATSGDFAFGTGDFTIESWVYLQATNDRTIWGYASSNSGGIALFNDQSGQRRIYVGTSPTMIVAGAFPVSTWFHVAVAREGSTLRLFQDGTLIGSVSNTTNLTATQFQVGASLYNSLWGYIDDFRITKGVARYQSAFTPPTAPFPDA